MIIYCESNPLRYRIYGQRLITFHSSTSFTVFTKYNVIFFLPHTYTNNVSLKFYRFRCDFTICHLFDFNHLFGTFNTETFLGMILWPTNYKLPTKCMKIWNGPIPERKLHAICGLCGVIE